MLSNSESGIALSGLTHTHTSPDSGAARMDWMHRELGRVSAQSATAVAAHDCGLSLAPSCRTEGAAAVYTQMLRGNRTPREDQENMFQLGDAQPEVGERHRRIGRIGPVWLR